MQPGNQPVWWFPHLEILWVDEILHHFEPMVETIVCAVFALESTHSRVSERWCLRNTDFATHSRKPTMTRICRRVDECRALRRAGVSGDRAGIQQVDPGKPKGACSGWCECGSSVDCTLVWWLSGHQKRTTALFFFGGGVHKKKQPPPHCIQSLEGGAVWCFQVAM